jgi:type II secretory ATPase GspE/PulE/Tfp pilus assembly ATPase PilB-like protein
VQLVEWLLRHAVSEGASDIHLEPFESFLRIRLRIDGTLHTILTPPVELSNPIVSRIKVMAEMDISERRRPQDGHIELPSATEELHFRVSTLPVVFGEKCVIRLLRKEAHLADRSRLGFTKEQFGLITRIAALPQGMILVTGPTGSGKTTTLHAVLNHINDPDVNIVTIEDPVEQTLAGINHVQVQEKGGVTFASALRAILRQDPDVVFVGEMRDPEVSAIAVKAALTGHLVLSTLHTNGTAETFARLTDMALPAYLLGSCVQLVVAQRLERRLCTCARAAPPDAETVARFGLTPSQVASAVTRQPVGCQRCMGSGYKGRVAVYEMVAPSARMRDVLRKGGDETALTAAMHAEGVQPMWEAGIARALAGDTTFDEVVRVIAQPESRAAE